MTNEEAKRIVKEEMTYAAVAHDYVKARDVSAAMAIAVKAIDMQSPARPIESAYGLLCPTCDYLFTGLQNYSADFLYHHCCCGQAINWKNDGEEDNANRTYIPWEAD